MLDFSLFYIMEKERKKIRPIFSEFIKRVAKKNPTQTFNQVYKGKDGNWYKLLDNSSDLADYHILNGLNRAIPSGFKAYSYTVKFHPTEKKTFIDKGNKVKVIISKNLENAGKEFEQDLLIPQFLMSERVAINSNAEKIHGSFFPPISYFAGIRDLKFDNLSFDEKNKEIIIFDPIFIRVNKDKKYDEEKYFLRIKKMIAKDDIEGRSGGLDFLRKLKNGKDGLISYFGSKNIHNQKIIDIIDKWLKYEKDRLVEFGVIKHENEFPGSFSECKIIHNEKLTSLKEFNNNKKRSKSI